MTGEVKLERECVKISHRTFIVFIVAIVTLVSSVVWYLADQRASLQRIEAKLDMTVMGCCPEEFKKLFGDARCNNCKKENNHGL